MSDGFWVWISLSRLNAFREIPSIFQERILRFKVLGKEGVEEDEDEKNNVEE